MEGLRTAEKEKSQKVSQDATVLIPVIKEFPHVDYAPAQRGPTEYTRRGITIGFSKDFEEIAAIRPLWCQMQAAESSPVPNADYDRFISVMRSIEGQVEPFVMYLKRDDKLLAMVIGRIQEHPLALKLGYLTLLRPKLKCLNIVYGGIMGRPEGELCDVLIEELMAQLKSRQADMIFFHYLKTDTAIYQSIRNAPGFLTRDYLPKTDKHWRMSVPEQMDQFYAARSYKHRSSLRRAIKKFEREYSGVKIVEYTSENDVADFIRIAAGISVKTYQAALNVGIVDDERTHSLLAAGARKGWFRGHILFAGGIACAFQLGLNYREVYYLVNLGYDPAFRTFKPGLILFLKVLEGLCDDPSVNTLDFYFGDAEYKQRYGNEHWQEANICLFAPRAYPRLINALQVTTTGVNTSLKYIVNRMGYVGWIKRKWRNRLSAANPSSVEARST